MTLLNRVHFLPLHVVSLYENLSCNNTPELAIPRPTRKCETISHHSNEALNKNDTVRTVQTALLWTYSQDNDISLTWLRPGGFPQLSRQNEQFFWTWSLQLIVTCMCVSTDGVWISDSIYWLLRVVLQTTIILLLFPHFTVHCQTHTLMSSVNYSLQYQFPGNGFQHRNYNSLTELHFLVPSIPWAKSKPKSRLLCDRWFTGHQFVFMSSPLRNTTRHFFLTKLLR
jgi:hypothetical protein